MSYILFHGDSVKAHSASLSWIKTEARAFHGSRFVSNAFILPVKDSRS